jgi:amino acid adenylation domain-containing protein
MLPDQLLESNRTEAVNRRSTVTELFERQAGLTPDAIAVICQEHRMSYRELHESSNRLAEHLHNLGVGPETLVGICMDRSTRLIVGLLAILKAGGAYVPLDPGHPQERLALVIEDSGMAILLASSRIAARLAISNNSITLVNVDDAALTHPCPQRVPSYATDNNLAYVMYTSGSTGKPKGVMVEHRNVVSFFLGMDEAIGRGPGVWLAVTSVAFDISVLELLWTLTRGFSVVIHGEDGVALIADEIVRHGVTHLQMTPSLARVLAFDPRAFGCLGSLKQILLGGEAMPASLARRLREVFSGELYNMYGPTETTIWSTTYRVHEPGLTIPIGRPIAKTQVYLLDSKLNPVPPGEPGELFIGGDGVARGYWNRPELTADQFITIPSAPSQRIYRTGDLARLQPDGNIEFLGRADYQIKLRGHRIEPGEVEALLERCTGVKQAVVVAREDKEGDQRLVAYVVAETASADGARVLRATLALKLPETMVPSAFEFVSSLPLTPNGKIDRKALLRLPPPSSQTDGDKSQVELASEMEAVVAGAWQQALGVSRVGLKDNFFDLGAHSLTVAEVHANLQRVLGREIPLVDLFQFSTVSTLAGHLAGMQPQGGVAGRAQRRKLARQR